MIGILKRFSLILCAFMHVISVQANGGAAGRQVLVPLIRIMHNAITKLIKSDMDLVQVIYGGIRSRPDKARVILTKLFGYGIETRLSKNVAEDFRRKILWGRKAAQLLPAGIAGGTTVGVSMGYVAGRHGDYSVGGQAVVVDGPSKLEGSAGPAFMVEPTFPDVDGDVDGIVQESLVQPDCDGPIESTRITHVVESGIQATHPQPIEISNSVLGSSQTDSSTVQNESSSLFNIISDHPVIVGTIIASAVAVGVWYYLYDTINFPTLRNIIDSIEESPADQTEQTLVIHKKNALRYAGRENGELKGYIEEFFVNIIPVQGRFSLSPSAHVAAGNIKRLINQ